MEEERSKEDVFRSCIALGDITLSALSDNYEEGLISGGIKHLTPLPNIQNQNYEFLVAYGKCDVAWNPARELYIEKFKDPNGKIYVTLSPVTKQTAQKIQLRRTTLSPKTDNPT